MSNNIHFLYDNAIKNPQQDLFNFKFYAEKVQKLIQLNSSNSDPITIGIYGKWGEGKTSFLNLIEHKIDHFEKKDGDKEYLIYHFNPWRYSNEDEMMFDFFDGLAKRFYVKKETNAQKIGKQLIKYSRYLKSIKISSSFGIPTKLGTKITFEPSVILETLGEDLKGEEITIEVLKDKVNEDLEKVNFKVVVFIDDLDRLDKEEIYTILKLIKLNANFKNFIFIVNLDSDHVAKAIKNRFGDAIEDGHLFLEKVINIPIHLPKIEDPDLREFFRKKLDQIKNNLSLSDTEKTNEMFKQIDMEFSANLFDSPREIIRILNSFFLGAFAIGDEVNLRDLFWIEYLKIKNGDCYNFIKNYHHRSGLQEFDTTVDFNDEYNNSNEKPNGSRKYILENFKKVSHIVNFLFPQYSGQFTVLGQKPNLDLLDKETRINSVTHYEKYFSFHNIRKISVIKLNEIEKLISQSNSEGLILLFENLFLDEKQHYKTLYKVELIIKELIKEDERNFFYSFLFNNFKLIPDSKFDLYGLDYRLRLIELVASTLEKDVDNDNTNIILSLAKHLDVYQLSHFTRKFDENKLFKQSLKNLIASKAETTFNINNPIYKDPNKASKKMIMYYWKSIKEKEYTNHIESTIITEEDIKLIIRNFPSFWNNTYFGPLENDNYEYMKQLVDVNFIFQKITDLNPNLVNKINPSTYNFPDVDANTEEQNLEQFIYWYKKDRDYKKLLLLS